MPSRPHSAATLAAARAPVRLVEAFRDLAGELRDAGIATPDLDSRLLVCHACGLSHEQFAAEPDRVLGAGELARIETLARRRRAREPVSRIAGTREFWGLDFAIGPETLDPRPDTETLVRAALEIAAQYGPSEPVSILDLGTGSGCILVSLLHELRFARGVGTDVSAGALDVARTNAALHCVADRARFVCTSWNRGINAVFDLVVANPPYIATPDLALLEPEVSAYDPGGALDGGSDGLDAYRDILGLAPDSLTPGGWALFEVGDGQAADVRAMIAQMEPVFVAGATREWRDLAGRVRCVAGKRSPRP